MLFTKSIVLPLAALASTVLADGASIGAALDTINSDTLALEQSVSAWDGDFLGTLSIVALSAELLVAIKEGAKTAKASAALDLGDAVTVAEKTITLAASVNGTITAIIAAKPKFDHLFISPVTLLNLDLEKSATDELSAAIVSKIPADLQPTAQTLVSGIDDSFSEGIAAYKLF